MDLCEDENVFIGTILFGKNETPIKIHILEYDLQIIQDENQDIEEEKKE